MTTENKVVMRRFVEFINTGSEKLAEELISPDAVFYVPGRPEPMRGPGGYLAIIGMMRAGFPDIQWTLEEMIAEDDKVAARFTMRGTHQGNFFGVPPTGKDDCGSSDEFLSTGRRPIRRGTWPAGFTWIAHANWCSATARSLVSYRGPLWNTTSPFENVSKVTVSHKVLKCRCG